MDRGIIYPGSVPLETDLLFAQRASMVGLSKLAAAILGAGTLVNGLAVTQTAVASMNVQVAAGEIYQIANLDATAYSSLSADTTHQIVKQGVNLDATLLALTAPGTGGFSINYLIQATLTEADNTPVVLPYYNASNPATAYSGPAGAGTAQNTRRTTTVTLSAKAGTAAATGTQATPAPDAGYVGLAVVTVANGAITVVNANISAYAAAPGLPSAGLVVGGLQGSACSISAAGGTADALTGSFQPAITALSNGMTLYVRAANANATATPSFTPASGVIAAKTIVKGAGQPLIPGDIAGAGHWVALQYDVTLDKWVMLNPASGVAAQRAQIQPIAAAVAANALTVTLNPTSMDFRSATLTSGAVAARVLSAAASLVVPLNATLGTTNAVAARLVVLALDNAGTIEPAIVNMAGGSPALDESGVISTTAISAAATSASTVYSTSARTNVAYRVVGFIDIAEATAGTWATPPTTVQGAGGLALAAMQSIGFGQTTQNVSGSRALSTTYFNLTGKPIFVELMVNIAAGGSFNLQKNGVQVQAQGNNSGVTTALSVSTIIRPGENYQVVASGGPTFTWFETR